MAIGKFLTPEDFELLCEYVDKAAATQIAVEMYAQHKITTEEFKETHWLEKKAREELREALVQEK